MSSSELSATSSTSLERYSSTVSARSSGMDLVLDLAQRGIALLGVDGRQIRIEGVGPLVGLHLDQVDDPAEVILRADRNLHDQRLGTEALDDGADGEEEVGAELVHLVDEADARDLVLVGLPPDGLRLGLDPSLPSNTATAPSSTRSERSTSTVKSSWPGVSMMLIWLSCQ